MIDHPPSLSSFKVLMLMLVVLVMVVVLMMVMAVVLMVMKKTVGTNRWWMVLVGRVQLLRVVVDGGDSDESGGWSGWSWREARGR